MDPISRSRRALEPGSGWKIVRTRQPARVPTPYDRPTPPENPNWLARFLYSPTRSIVSGAGKVLSSVLNSGSSSEYTSSSENSDDEEGDDDDYVSSQEDEELNKRNGTSEPVFMPGETKHTIEQLLRQETFSREESDKLIKIIKSRVVGFTATEDVQNTRLDMDANGLSATAVSEAKKWITEKRFGSASKSGSGHGTILLPHGGEDDGGSPVDVAKSYMRALPPWASPSKHGELRSTSPLGMQLFNEQTPFSRGGNSVTSKLKRDTPATGSWNIQEELRKVRTKATEDMLRSLPSSKMDWSAFSQENISNLNSSQDGKQEAGLGDKLKSPITAAGLTTDSSLGITTTRTFDATEKTKDGLQTEALTSGTEQPNVIVDETIQYSKVHDQTENDVAAHTANGFPYSEPREATVVSGEINQVSLSDGKIVTTLLVEETHELDKVISKNNEMDIECTVGPGSTPAHEASVEAPKVNVIDIDGSKDQDSAASGSQNSSGMPEELSQELTQPRPESNNTVKVKKEAVEKPRAKRFTKSTRRGRARGK